MRKLVTIRVVDQVCPIEGADRIELAIIGGWQCVVGKGDFTAGDYGVYFEIDSFLPDGDQRFASMLARRSITYLGKVGHKLTTARFKKQLSQGLLLPLSLFPEIAYIGDTSTVVSTLTLDDQDNWILDGCVTLDAESFSSIVEGVDYSSLIGVIKWEYEAPAGMAGQVSGNFPRFIPKTDQERCQNIKRTLQDLWNDVEFEVTVKRDGTSATYFKHEDEIGACSRNLQLKINEANADNLYIRIGSAANQNGKSLFAILNEVGRNLAFQGEIFGPGIQQNFECVPTHTFNLFSIYDIDNKRYFAPDERRGFCYEQGIAHVPVKHKAVKLKDIAADLGELLVYASGPGETCPYREGLVFVSTDGKFSFKVVSNEYLLKKDKKG